MKAYMKPIDGTGEWTEIPQGGEVHIDFTPMQRAGEYVIPRLAFTGRILTPMDSVAAMLRDMEYVCMSREKLIEYVVYIQRLVRVLWRAYQDDCGWKHNDFDEDDRWTGTATCIFRDEGMKNKRPCDCLSNCPLIAEEIAE